MTRRSLGVILLTLAYQAGTQAAEVRVLASNGVKAVIEELVPQYEKATGNKVSIEFGSTSGLKQKIEAGEAFDVTMLTADVIDEGIKGGKIAVASRADLARCGVGVGVRTGAPKPDISTPEAFKQTLLKAKSVTWAQDGASRVYIGQMLDTFGIAENVKAKAVLEQGSVRATARVADGQTELVMTLVSEILPVHGIELVGPFPAKVQNYVNFAAGVGAHAANAKAGEALIKFLKGPAAALVYKAKGMEPR